MGTEKFSYLPLSSDKVLRFTSNTHSFKLEIHLLKPKSRNYVLLKYLIGFTFPLFFSGFIIYHFNIESFLLFFITYIILFIPNLVILALFDLIYEGHLKQNIDEATLLWSQEYKVQKNNKRNEMTKQEEDKSVHGLGLLVYNSNSNNKLGVIKKGDKFTPKHIWLEQVGDIDNYLLDFAVLTLPVAVLNSGEIIPLIPYRYFKQYKKKLFNKSNKHIYHCLGGIFIQTVNLFDTISKEFPSLNRKKNYFFRDGIVLVNWVNFLYYRPKFLNNKRAKLRIGVEHTLVPVVDAVQICIQCGSNQRVLNRSCEKCGYSFLFCYICKRGFSPIDTVFQCFRCEVQYHSKHILDVVKMFGDCPSCKREILISEIEKKINKIALQ